MKDAAKLTPQGLNQPPLFIDVNLWESDAVLRDSAAQNGASRAFSELAGFGKIAGGSHAQNLARQANENIPMLVEDSSGHGARVDYDPAYHELMGISMRQGLHCSTWDHLAEGGELREGSHVARAAAFYMAAQMEAGHCCPVTMTHAAVGAMKAEPDILRQWLPMILSREYDPTFVPAAEKRSATIGMGMTEIQGGTDVRGNITQAKRIKSGEGTGEYEITGHKFFMSAPMCDAFLVLAQAPGGLSCFLLPRFRPDRSVNALRFVRLKDKLGNRSNASSEVEFDGAYATLLGEEGRGIQTIIEMVTLTRLDCAVSSAGLMRFGLAHAIHHCRHRVVFGKKLTEHALMEAVLADMALHVEAATLFAFRVAKAFDSPENETDAAWRRLMTPVAKYWTCKTAPAFSYEAMECLGGNGYVEDASALARIYREVPVNAIWEGSGNVMCLDVLRVMKREPETLSLVLSDLSGSEPEFEELIGQIKRLVGDKTATEDTGRFLTGLLAELATCVLMRAHAPDVVADAYISTRLRGRHARQFGETPSNRAAGEILERALPGE